MKLPRLNRSILATGLLATSLALGACGDDDPSDPAEATDLAFDALGGRDSVAQLSSLSFEAEGTTTSHMQSATPGLLNTVNAFTLKLSYLAEGQRFRIEHERDHDYPFDVDRAFTQIINGDVGWTEGLEGLPGLAVPGDILPNKVAALSTLHTIMTPHLLFKRVIDGEITAQDAGNQTIDGTAYRLVSLSVGSVPVTAFIDPSSGELARLALTISDTLLCDVELQIIYQDWQDVSGGLRFPATVTLEGFGGVLYREARSEIAINPALDESLLALPPEAAGITDADLAESGQKRFWFHNLTSAYGVPFALPQAEVAEVQLGPGIFLLTASHNTLAVEQANGIVLIEAPLSGDRSAAVAAWASDKFPGKPISHVIATHHHLDHSGGLRHFAADQTAIVMAEQSVDFFRDEVFEAACTVIPDRLTDGPLQATLEGVPTNGSSTLDDPTNPITMHHIQSIHSDDMLVIELPEQGILFNSDIYNPLPVDMRPPGFLPYFSAAELLELDSELTRLSITPTIIVGGHAGVSSMETFNADVAAAL